MVADNVECMLEMVDGLAMVSRRDVFPTLWRWVRTTSAAGQRARCFRYRPAVRDVEHVDKAFAAVLRRQLLMRSGGGLRPPWVTR
jgi:hypothetical protein